MSWPLTALQFLCDLAQVQSIPGMTKHLQYPKNSTSLFISTHFGNPLYLSNQWTLFNFQPGTNSAVNIPILILKNLNSILNPREHFAQCIQILVFFQIPKHIRE